MEAFESAGVDFQTRKTSKRRRFEDVDDCVPAKRTLTEEAMAAIMHQLNLTSSSVPSLSPSSLNITAVTTCPAASVTEPMYCNNDSLMRGTTPSSHWDDNSSSHRLLTPPHTFLSPTKPKRVLGSAVTEGLDLASSVRIRVTPATPPSSECSGSPSQDEYEPMEQSSLSKRPSRGWAVVVEDISSSDSSDNEVPQRMWIAPELQTLTANQRHLLPPPILDEIAKNGMAVVPWVEREQYLTRALAKLQVPADDTEDSSSEGEEGSQDMQCWESASMH